MGVISPRAAGAMALPILAAVAASCSTGGDDAVSREDVQENVADELEQLTGERPSEVDCPDDLDAEEGATMRCTLAADDGSSIGVTMTVTEVDGDNVQWDIQVDDTVESGPTD